MEKFEITDYDLDNEFNQNRKRRKFTKNDAIYGIWNDEDDDSDGDVDVTGRKKRLADKPVAFVSAGDKANKRKDKILNGEYDDDDEDEGRSGWDIEDDDEQEREDDDDADDGAERPGLGTGLGYKGSPPPSRKQQPGRIVDDPFRKGAGKSDFGKKGAQGLGVSQQQQQQAKPRKVDKDFGEWEKYTKGVGMKLLEKMGYQKGMGIGRGGEGLVNPVQPKLRAAKKGGLGFGGDERTEQQIQDDREKGREYVDEEEQIKEQIKLWKKGIEPGTQPAQAARKPKTQYTFSSMSRTAAAQATAQKTKVIDMTGPQARVFDSYAELGGPRKPGEESGALSLSSATDASLPELQHNIRLLVEFAEGEIQSLEQKMEAERDALAVLENECKKVDEQVHRQEQQSVRLEEILAIVEWCEARRSAGQPLDIEEATKVFRDLQARFAEEFETYNLAYLAVAIVFPLVIDHMKQWSPLQQPGYGYELFKIWRSVLTETDTSRSRYMDVYSRLVWEVWVPPVRRAVANWDPRTQNAILVVMDTWKPILPRWVYDNVIEQLIFPRICTWVNAWSPATDVVPIHQWLQPWIAHLGYRMEQLYPIIRQKLMFALQQWVPADPSAHAILLPWKSIFRPEDMEGLLLRSIIPKLTYAMSSFVVNPANQALDQLRWTMAWADLVPPQHLLTILEQSFFPKWFDVLVKWLNSNPDLDEVTNWYVGWKQQFPADLRDCGPMKAQFDHALKLMNEHVANPGRPVALKAPPPMNSAKYFADMQRQRAAEAAMLAKIEKDRQQDATVGFSFKDMLQKMAAEHDLLFQPKNRTEKGNVVYSFGKAAIFLDRNVAFMQHGDKWLPVSIEALLDKAL